MTEHESTLPRPRRRRWRGIVFGLLLLVIGMTAGSAITVIVLVHRVHYAVQHPEEAPGRITRLLHRRLDLTPAQTDQVRQILIRRQQALRDIRREIQPRVKSELDQTRDDIGKVLTDQQRTRWNEMYDRLVHRWMPAVASQPGN